MNDSYVECLVKGKKNTKASILRILLVLVAILSAVAAAYFTFFVGSRILSGVAVILTIATAVGAYYSSGYINVEYEYLYFDKEITIDRIYNQEKRKRVAVYSMEKVEVIAPIKSYHLDKFGKVSENAKDYGVGEEEKPDLRYIMFYEGKEQVIFNPNEEMVKMMKNQAPRKVFSD